MADRQAPAQGYDFSGKRQYRRNVWATMAEALPVPASEAKVVIMPSIEGDEIEVVLSKGIREQNIYIVDANPAIVATHRRRFKNLAGAIGVHASRLHTRIPLRSIHAANLDLCGNISSTHQMGSVLSMRACLSPRSVLAVTTLRGRERRWASYQEMLALCSASFESKGKRMQLPDSLADGDRARLLSLLSWLVGTGQDFIDQDHGQNLTDEERQMLSLDLAEHDSVLRAFTYGSGRSTFLVSVFVSKSELHNDDLYVQPSAPSLDNIEPLLRLRCVLAYEQLIARIQARFGVPNSGPTIADKMRKLDKTIARIKQARVKQAIAERLRRARLMSNRQTSSHVH